MIGQSNIDDVRARIMALESASVFDERAWQEALADLAAQQRPSALADAERRMATAQKNSIGGIDWAAGRDYSVTQKRARKTYVLRGKMRPLCAVRVAAETESLHA